MNAALESPLSGTFALNPAAKAEVARFLKKFAAEQGDPALIILAPMAGEMASTQQESDVPRVKSLSRRHYGFRKFPV